MRIKWASVIDAIVATRDPDGVMYHAPKFSDTEGTPRVLIFTEDDAPPPGSWQVVGDE